ncbi:uncharacterized protein LOC112081846 isoform X1 [Eutrema salsugineum]|uniref:uncharacterized protein LOC112081846 isoform X1 n=1 Tax=Eutrema salsugineum TaxID=72664 RepID=UPI000CED6A09|nr:uncharacterized protein LOC112081846 isoform X1 [Eutrema salsugineum]
MLLLCFSSSSCFHTSSRRLAVSMTRWMVDFKAMRPPLLSSVISGLSSPVSLPLLPARLPLIVCHLLPKRCLSAVGFGDFEARFCRTTTMIAFLRGFSSSSDNTISFPLPVLQVCSCSSLSVSSALECYRMIVEWVALVLWNLGLICYVMMVLVSFGSTLLPCSGILVALVRSFTAVCSVFTVEYSVLTAVCSFSIVLNPVFGAVSLFSFFWWQIEDESNITSPPVIQVPSVFVTLWVALDAVFQEVHEIVLVFRFLMAFYELYCQSIFRHLLPCFHVFSLLLVVLFTLSIEFEASK